MECSIPYSRGEILEAQEKTGLEKEKVICAVVMALCHCTVFKNTVASLVKKGGGNEEDIKDVLQEGLFTLLKNLRNGKYKGNSNIENYAFAICKYKWWNQNPKQFDLPPLQEYQEEDHFSDELKQILFLILEQLSGQCSKLLKLWALNYTEKEIEAELKIGRVRQKIYQCKIKLREWISDHPSLGDWLKDFDF